MFGNRAVDVAAPARSRLPPFHARGGRAKVDLRHVLDAAPLMAAVIDADIQSGFGIGAVDGIGPRFPDRLDVGGRGGNSSDANLLFPALDLFRGRPGIGDFAKAVRVKLAMRDEDMGMNVPAVVRRMDRNIGGDTVPGDDRGEKIQQQPPAPVRIELVRQAKLKLGRNPPVAAGLCRLRRVPQPLPVAAPCRGMGRDENELLDHAAGASAVIRRASPAALVVKLLPGPVGGLVHHAGTLAASYRADAAMVVPRRHGHGTGCRRRNLPEGKFRKCAVRVPRSGGLIMSGPGFHPA